MTDLGLTRSQAARPASNENAGVIDLDAWCARRSPKAPANGFEDATETPDAPSPAESDLKAEFDRLDKELEASNERLRAMLFARRA